MGAVNQSAAADRIVRKKGRTLKEEDEKKVKLLEQGGRRGLQHVFFPWKARRKSQQKRAVHVTDVGEICQLRSNASTCQPLALALP